jgi:hypothetical protein
MPACGGGMRASRRARPQAYTCLRWRGAVRAPSPQGSMRPSPHTAATGGSLCSPASYVSIRLIRQQTHTHAETLVVYAYAYAYHTGVCV